MEFDFRYTAIRARDLEASLRFYRDVLGMRVVGRAKAPETHGEMAMLSSRRGGPRLEINWYADDSPVARPYPDQEGEELDHLAFRVGDLDAALAFLATKGHPVVRGPIRGTGATWAYVKDPDGIWVEVFQEFRGPPRES